MIDRFEELRTFTIVAQHRSFSRAARELGVALSAVSRRVRELEDRLGIQLLQRTTRQVSLTALGEQLRDRALRVLEELATADELAAASGGVLTGTLRVSAPVTFGVHRLAPVLCEFQAAHPGLMINLGLDDRLTDLVASGIDVALRIWRRPEPSSLIALRLARVHYVVCGSPAYFARAGVPRTAADLADHHGLAYTNVSRTAYWELTDTRTGVTSSPRVRSAFECDNGDVLRAAAIAGNGVAILPRFLVADALRDGTLQSVLADHERAPVYLYVLHPSRRHVPAPTRDFVRFAVARYGKELGDAFEQEGEHAVAARVERGRARARKQARRPAPLSARPRK